MCVRVFSGYPCLGRLNGILKESHHSGGGGGESGYVYLFVCLFVCVCLCDACDTLVRYPRGAENRSQPLVAIWRSGGPFQATAIGVALQRRSLSCGWWFWLEFCVFIFAHPIKRSPPVNYVSVGLETPKAGPGSFHPWGFFWVL